MLLTTTNGYEVQIDKIDVDLNKYGWHVNTRGYVVCNTRQDGMHNKKMHAVIAKRMGLKKGFEADHENGIKTDNRRKNLRFATHSQNLANSKRYSTNTSGYKGVSRHGNKWQAEICVRGKKLYLGYFKDPEEAHEAYIKAAQKYFGEFANSGV